METEYVQTEFATITDGIRESFRIRGRVRGVNLIPLAKGESPPAEVEPVETETFDEPEHVEDEPKRPKWRLPLSE